MSPIQITTGVNQLKSQHLKYIPIPFDYYAFEQLAPDPRLIRIFRFSLSLFPKEQR